jgi:hypothetical protein
MSDREIIERLDGDSKLFEVWIKFLFDMGWLTKDEKTGDWLLTDAGRLEIAERKVLEG